MSSQRIPVVFTLAVVVLAVSALLAAVVYANNSRRGQWLPVDGHGTTGRVVNTATGRVCGIEQPASGRQFCVDITTRPVADAQVLGERQTH